MVSAGVDSMIDDRARDALRLAETAIAHAEREGATEAEALVMSDEAALTRFANSQIHQNVAESNVVVNLRFVVGKRVGVASSGRTDDEGLRRLAANAGAIARVVEELEDWGGLPGPTHGRGRRGRLQPPRPPSASPESRAEGVREVIAAADAAGVTAYGSFSTGTETVAVANSKGARQLGTRTVAQLLTVSMGPGRRQRLRGDRGGRLARRSTRRPSAGRHRPRPAQRRTPSRSMPANTPSSSRSTRSSTSWTCSATSGSAHSPCRRVGASSRSASASAATS